MSRPIRILSTRALDTALIDQARANGIGIDTVLFIETTPILDEALARQVRALANDRLTVIFTSMNAVEAVAAMLTGAEAAAWKIFCIGAATRRLVEKYFGKPVIAGTAPSAAALARVAMEEGVEEAVFFCGDQRREELPAILSRGGVRVRELVVYHTTETPRVVEAVYDGVAFFSPSAVRSFFSVNMARAATCYFAIGETTADAIRSYASRSPVVISKMPEKEALVRQIIEYFQKHI